MPEIGPLEILVIAVVALIVFGPEKLPDMARKVGNFAADMRRMSNEVRSEYRGVLDDDDDDDPFFPEDESSTRVSSADEDDGVDEDDPPSSSGSGRQAPESNEASEEAEARPGGDSSTRLEAQ